MWKFISRGVRETFERGVNIGRADVRVKKEAQNNSVCCWRFTSIVSRPNNCLNGKARETNDEDEPRNRRHKTATYNVYDSWIGAVSYSGALALGWVLSQPYHRWRKWWDVRERKKFCLGSIKPGSLVQLLSKVAVAQPLKVVYNKDTSVQLCDDDIVDDTTTYGPKTAEEALDEAAEEFRAVHNTLLGEVENKRGVDCIGRREHRQAVALFKSATKLGYAPAAYNLAQCYEMGLGLKQDFSQAAKWYQIAVNNGHSTAMYNLGVFYAHGWGGLEADTARARQLFTEAARRGQPDAKIALGIHESQTKPTSVPNLQKDNIIDYTSCRDSVNCNNDSNYGNDPNKLFNMAISYENSIEDSSTDPYLILQMYQLASELGHSEAKSRLHVLKAYDAIGLLSEFLLQGKKMMG